MTIALEAPVHVNGIGALHRAAFPTSLEADLVDRLRADGDTAISLVALDGDEVIGHVVLSPMAAPFRALGLGPVAVRPDRQKRGVGRELISAALHRARSEGWEAVFVLGDPAYYTRFGFSVAAAEGFTSPYAGPYFMMLALSDSRQAIEAGRVDYAPAFRDLE